MHNILRLEHFGLGSNRKLMLKHEKIHEKTRYLSWPLKRLQANIFVIHPYFLAEYAV